MSTTVETRGSDPGAMRTRGSIGTGEKDFTCPPDEIEASAETTGKIHYEVLQGLGHFPMSEHYERFRSAPMRTLAETARRRGGRA